MPQPSRCPTGGCLAELLLAECDDRARRRSERRIKAAEFPREKSLRAFDTDANPNIDPATIRTLAKCDWVTKGQPLCLIGDSSTGKSHLLIAPGTEAAMSGCRVKYTLATKLANELVEAADEKTLSKTIARHGRVDLLCIDELGYMQLGRRGAKLLFQVLTEHEEKASVAITDEGGEPRPNHRDTHHQMLQFRDQVMPAALAGPKVRHSAQRINSGGGEHRGLRPRNHRRRKHRLSKRSYPDASTRGSRVPGSRADFAAHRRQLDIRPAPGPDRIRRPTAGT
ncbi:ATP-binding protein [Amycolatopsis sp. A1MSW2902]|uniref:ATP-binding protein n=1 Tax=Amycolatopsis sp. A1MSW2902 TaxID=687413 RepID=UPI00307DB1EC